MINGSTIRKMALAAPVLALAAAASPQAFAATLYSQGFEGGDTTGWVSAPTPVTSGTSGITAASGSYYAKAVQDNYTNWGTYNNSNGGLTNAFVPYTTSIDIYLNVDGGFTNDTRFDFTSAINDSTGAFHRDFIFNAGFYNDATGPGASSNRFVISTGNNSQPGSAYAKDPGHDPIAISTTGWYTFQWDFTNDGGVLAVVMSILDSGDSIVHQWTLSDATDLIGGIGGNRYGWFDYNQFEFLAIDNATLTTNPSEVPLPATLPLFASGLGAFGLFRWRKKRKSAVAAA